MNSKLIIAYTTERDSEIEAFKNKIAKRILEGWQPFGSMTINAGYLYQPMVMYER